MTTRTDTLEVRFWAKVDRRDPDWCWLWTASQTAGYGQIWDGPRNRGAHRVAYELCVGPIPEGLEIDHLCEVRLCMNPKHMDLVIPKVNKLRSTGPSAINARKTHCPNGHAYDEANTYISPKGRRKCRACDVVRHRLRG